jgi:hypothetical protein
MLRPINGGSCTVRRITLREHFASTADRPSDQRFGVQRNQLSKGTLGFGLLVDPAITHAPTVLAILIDLDLDWLARK